MSIDQLVVEIVKGFPNFAVAFLGVYFLWRAYSKQIEFLQELLRQCGKQLNDCYDTAEAGQAIISPDKTNGKQ